MSARASGRKESAAASRVPRARKTAPGTPPADTAGGTLERRVARLEFAQGALARLRVPVAARGAEPGRDVLTDIDVLSAEVDFRLRISRSSHECKTGRGQAGEPNTLLWLAGFRQLLKLDRVVFVRPTISGRGRALAQQLSIAVLDEQTLTERERAAAWLPERFAHVDGPGCTAAESRTDTQLRGLPDIPASLAHFLRYESLLADSQTVLGSIAALGAATDRQGVLPDPARLVLASHSLVSLLAAALTDASRLDNITARTLAVRLERALTAGGDEDGRMLTILERADNLVRYVIGRTHRAYVDAGAEPVQIDIPSLRDVVATPPTFVDDYVDLVLRLRNNPTIARDILQTAELACFDGLMGDSAWSAPAFAHLFTPEHHGLLQVAVRTLDAIAGPRVTSALATLHDSRFAGATGLTPDRHSAPASSPTAPSTDQRSPGDNGDAVTVVDAATLPADRTGTKDAEDDTEVTLL